MVPWQERWVGRRTGRWGFRFSVVTGVFTIPEVWSGDRRPVGIVVGGRHGEPESARVVDAELVGLLRCYDGSLQRSKMGSGHDSGCKRANKRVHDVRPARQVLAVEGRSFVSINSRRNDVRRAKNNTDKGCCGRERTSDSDSMSQAEMIDSTWTCLDDDVHRSSVFVDGTCSMQRTFCSQDPTFKGEYRQDARCRLSGSKFWIPEVEFTSETYPDPRFPRGCLPWIVSTQMVICLPVRLELQGDHGL